MTIDRRSGDKLGGIFLSRRGVEAFDAGLEVVFSPAALWLRLMIAAILGSVLTGLGLMVGFIIISRMTAGTLSEFGGPLGPAVGGAACIILGLIVFAGGSATFKSYRRRGLI